MPLGARAASSSGQGRTGARQRNKKIVNASACSFDFAFTARPSTGPQPTEKLVCLVLKDSHTQAVYAIPTPAKGGTVALKFMIDEICRFLNYCGHTEVTLKSDSEPSCLALQGGVRAFRAKLKMVTHLEQTAPRDHQANPAEQAIDSVRQLAGTLLSQYEQGTGAKVETMDAIHAWAWRHASFLLMRYARNVGPSPFELINGRPYAGKLVGFGVRVCACEVICQRKGKVGTQMASALKDMPWSQAAFLAGQLGQARAQKSLEQPVQPAIQPEPEVAAIDSSKAPMPYPGYVVPDDAMLSELIPPPPVTQVRMPEAPTPSREQQAGDIPVTPMEVQEQASRLVPLPAPGPVAGAESSGLGIAPDPRHTRAADGVPGGAEASAPKRLRLNGAQAQSLECMDEATTLEGEPVDAVSREYKVID